MYTEDSTPPPSYTSHSFSHRSPSFKLHPKKSSISKLSISGPISAKPSRTSSASSTASSPYSSRSSSPSTNIDLEQRATEILNTIYNAHSPQTLTQLLHPSLHAEHEYIDVKTLSSRSAYLQHWQEKLQKFPNFQADIKECAVDEMQGKVWVVSEIVCDSEGLQRRQVVDMLTFDAEGLMVQGSGFFRKVSMRGDD